VAELPDVFGAEVGEFVLLPVTPKILDRIEFRGVGRKISHGEAVAVPVHVAADEQTTVNLGAVPDNQELAGKNRRNWPRKAMT